MKLPLLTIFICLLAACKEPAPQRAGVPILPRDTSITVENSVSDLFLDSNRLEAFLEREVPSDTVRQRFRNFYAARNYGYAWFTEHGLSLPAEGFWNTHDTYLRTTGDSTSFDRLLHGTMQRLLYGDSTVAMPPDSIRLTELRLTHHFFEYVRTAFGPSADPEALQWHIPSRRLDPSALLDSLISGKGNEWRPLNENFHKLQEAVLRFRALGGQAWPEIGSTTGVIRPGERSDALPGLRTRLHTLGFYQPEDTGTLYDSGLEAAVIQAQRSFGLTDDGVVGPATFRALNVSPDARIRQLLLNMERAKWMPATPADRIVVNIPEYRLRVFTDGEEAFSSNVVVGKAASRTVVFSDELKYIVFAPYWNIPRSIVQNEILPAMQRSSGYLERNNMEVTGYSGGLPVVRQRPGAGNALGRVKFIFPNSYNIYFHDTPAKSLFGRDQRAFSHGCIRVEKPFELASYLLRNREEWTDESIRDAMYSNKEKWVPLEKTLPVFLTYFTAWADDEGTVHFREDIYGHDKELAEHLFK